jgi:peroxiredoxin
MKKGLYAVLLLCIIAACQEKKRGAFVVSGVVENAPGKKVLLMESPYANAQPVILDSAILKDKGEFTLRGRANEEGIFRLIIENGPDVILVNDNNSIKVRLDVNDYRNYTVEGSPASQSLHNLFEDYRTRDAAILTTFKQIDSIKATTGQDSLLEAMQTANDKQIAALNDMLKKFVDESPSPAASLFALGMASQTVPNAEVITMVDATSKKFPEHTGLAKIKSMLAVKSAPSPSTETDASGSSYALLNKQAPDLTMNDVDGKPVSISNFKGKWVLVDFWASWCGPCRQENPNVVAAFNRYKNKNFTILGVSLDEDKEQWKKAIAKDNLAWNHMSDLKQWESAAVNAYGFEGIPFNVLLDPTGKIIASSLRGEDLERKLAEVLK